MPPACARLFSTVLFLWILFPLAAGAQTVSAVGTDETLDVATWNIEWFGNTSNGPGNEPRQFDNVRAIIEGSEIDLWAVQEISDPTVFQALLDSLGSGFGGALATYSQTQKIGFIYRTNVVVPRRVRHILDEFSYAFGGRPPLELEADVLFADTTFRATFITLHMKAMSDVASYDRRAEASQRLKNRLDFFYGSDNLIILGDYNDRLMTSITSGQDTPYRNFLNDPSRYRFVTYEAEEAGEVSFIGSQRSMIDHILITDEFFDSYEEGSAEPWSDLTRTFIGFVTTTSDHLPVYARFEVATGTSTEVAELPLSASLSAPYPNPTAGVVNARYVLDRPAEVRIEVYDVEGRRVEVVEEGLRAAGAHDLTWASDSVAPGIYLLRMTAGQSVMARTVAVLR